MTDRFKYAYRVGPRDPETGEILGDGYVKYIAHMGDDLSIVEAARMSTTLATLDAEPRADRNLDARDKGLLRYLDENRHTSPFEMCELLVEMRVPLLVLAHLVRHRTFSFNVESRRYRSDAPTFWPVPLTSLRHEDSTLDPDEIDTTFASFYADAEADALEAYQRAIKDGVVNEQARFVLPQTTMCSLRMKGNLHNWFHFLTLRDDPHTQAETRMYAYEIAEIIDCLWPEASALYHERKHGLMLREPELTMLQYILSGDTSSAVYQWRQATTFTPLSKSAQKRSLARMVRVCGTNAAFEQFLDAVKED